MDILIVASGAVLSLLIVAAVFYWIAHESRDARQRPAQPPDETPIEPNAGLHVSESRERRN